jgi:hypothetical protein
MGDGDVQKEGDPIQRETKIGPLAIFSAGLRDRLQSSLAKKWNKELQEGGVARGDRPAPKILAHHKMIRQKLVTTRAMGVGGRWGGG